MSFDATPTDRPLTGILIPDPNLEVWSEHSNIDEHGIRPWRVVPDQPTSLRVLATGTPASARPLELMTQHPGAAGGVARFIARPGLTASELAEDVDPYPWLGRDDASSLTHWEHIGDSPEATSICGSASIVVTRSGTEVVCYRRFTGSDGVYVRSRPAGGTWGAEVEVFKQSVPSSDTAPCLVLTEGGRLDVYLLSAYTAPVCVVRYSSTDEGATWTWSSVGVLEIEGSDEALAALTISVAEGGGQTMLVATVVDDGVPEEPIRWHYASSDDGASFDFVANTLGLHRALHYHRGYFYELVSAAHGDELEEYDILCVVYGSAFQALDPATAGSVVWGDGYTLPNNDGRDRCALWTDDSGALWALVRTYDTGDAYYNRGVRIMSSTDQGQTWKTAGNAFGVGTTETPFRSIAACWGRGSASLFATLFAGDQIYAGRLGGWTDRTVALRTTGAPDAEGGPEALDQLSWGEPWGQLFLAAQGEVIGTDQGWERTDSGSVTVSGGAAACTISAATDAEVIFEAGADLIFRPIGALRVAITSFPEGVATLEVTARQGGVSTAFFGVQMLLDNGSWKLKDMGSGLTLIGPEDLPEEPFEVVLAVGRNASSWTATAKCHVAIRLLSQGPDERRYLVWDAYGDQTLTEWASHGRTRSGARIVVGDGDEASTLAIRHAAAITSKEGIGWALPPGAVTRDLLRGAPWSPTPVYVREGVSVQAAGSTLRGQSWVHTPDYRYSFRQALPTVLSDPRRGWRSGTEHATDVHIALGIADRGKSLNSEAFISSATSGLPSLFGIYLDGQDWATIALDTWTDSEEEWVERLPPTTPGFAVGLTGAATVWYAATTDDDLPPWLEEDELVGSRLQLDEGGSVTVLANTEGNAGGDGLAARIMTEQLSDFVDESEGAVISPRVLILVYLADDQQAVRLRFTRPTTTDVSNGAIGNVDPRPGIRVLAAGRVRVLGSGWDETRAVRRELGKRIVEGDDGSRSEVRDRDDRRRVELSLVRGAPMDTQGRVSHGYVTAQRGGPPVGGISDAATMAAVLAKVGRSPIVYLPDIPILPPPAATRATLTPLRRLRGPIYGRFGGDSYAMESVQGYADSADEVVRSSVVTIEEEIG